MKRGPIPKKLQAIMLHPNIRIGILEDLKELEDRVLKMKKTMVILTDDLLNVYTDLQILHSRIRELGSGRTTDEDGRKSE